MVITLPNIERFFNLKNALILKVPVFKVLKITRVTKKLSSFFL